jgi:hypothetical protein
MAPLHVEEKQVAPGHLASVGGDAPSGETREIRAGSSDPFHPHSRARRSTVASCSASARLPVLSSARVILHATNPADGRILRDAATSLRSGGASGLSTQSDGILHALRNRRVTGNGAKVNGFRSGSGAAGCGAHVMQRTPIRQAHRASVCFIAPPHFSPHMKKA